MEAETSSAITEDSQVREECNIVSSVEAKKINPGGTFKCSYCPLEEHYDYKGRKPPFARQIKFSNDCYVMKDPMSMPNKGEVLVLGADCSLCNKVVCLGCSVFYTKTFCQKCATDYMKDLPPQLHAKIKSFTNEQKS